MVSELARDAGESLDSARGIKPEPKILRGDRTLTARSLISKKASATAQVKVAPVQFADTTLADMNWTRSSRMISSST
jgi:hypothetical protein